MPKMGKMSFSRATTARDEKIEWTSDVKVSSEGEFSIAIPEELYNKTRDGDFDSQDARIEYYRNRKTQAEAICVVSSTLDKCKRYIGKLLDEWAKTKTEVNLVICYCLNIDASWYKMPDGSIYPNNEYDDKKCGAWCGKRKTSFNSNYTSVGIGAWVLIKLTHKGNVGERSEFVIPRNAENIKNIPEIGPWGKKLNLISGTYPDRYFCDGHRDDKYSVIPYTEDAARLFFTKIMSIFKMADDLTRILATQESINEEIKTGNHTTNPQRPEFRSRRRPSGL